MRQLKCGLLAGAALFALTSTAVAGDLRRGFSGVKSGFVADHQVRTDVPPDPLDGQIRGQVDAGQGNGGSVRAVVELNSNLVSFESGTATVGDDYLSHSQSGIDIRFRNAGDGTIDLHPFASTITPAGMGIYVQERMGAPAGGNPFTGYGQSQTVGFEAFFQQIGFGVTFAQAAFDFQVVTQTENVLYSLSGVTSLSFDRLGNLVINENLTGAEGAGQRLNRFRTVTNTHHALAYDWQATNILIPLEGSLGPYASQVVSYRTNVSSWSKAACINNGVNCIVAFAGFGDPIGRGGGDELAQGFGDAGAFHADNPNEDFIITGLNFRRTTVSVAPGIPEPSTWAVMITGFGLAGAALRRRRRVAYT